MNCSRHAIASLGLLVALLSVMAFGAGVAQGEPGNHWRLNGTVISGSGSDPVEVTEIENGTGSLLTKINNTQVKFLCTEMKLKNVALLANGNISEGTAAFHGCVTYLNGNLSVPCEPFSGSNKGLIQSEKFKGLLSLHEGELLALITPVGTNIAIILLGEECAIGEEIPVAGKLTLLDSGMSVENTVHLIKEGPLTSLSALGNPATIDGAAVVRLSGGPKFSGFKL